MKKIDFNLETCESILNGTKNHISSAPKDYGRNAINVLKEKAEAVLSEARSFIKAFSESIERREKDLKEYEKRVQDIESTISSLESERANLPPITEYVPARVVGGREIPAHYESRPDVVNYDRLTRLIDEEKHNLEKAKKDVEDAKKELEHLMSIMIQLQSSYNELSHDISRQLEFAEKDVKDEAESTENEVCEICRKALTIMGETNVSLDKFTNKNLIINFNDLKAKCN